MSRTQSKYLNDSRCIETAEVAVLKRRVKGEIETTVFFVFCFSILRRQRDDDASRTTPCIALSRTYQSSLLPVPRGWTTCLRLFSPLCRTLRIVSPNFGFCLPPSPLRRTNTPYMCEAFCTSLRYPFFALEDSQWCHCGVIPSNTPRSVQVPAYLPGKGYEPDLSPPNASHAAKSVPEGVRVGDPRFACHLGRCSGNPSLWGCGGDAALDVYMNLEPCVLFRDCEDAH